MKVRAIQMGYCNLKRQYPGDVFHVAEDQFSDKWMEKVAKVDEKKEVAKPAKSSAKFKKDDNVI
jgi:hypothetical protein